MKKSNFGSKIFSMLSVKLMGISNQESESLKPIALTLEPKGQLKEA